MCNLYLVSICRTCFGGGVDHGVYLCLDKTLPWYLIMFPSHLLSSPFCSLSLLHSRNSYPRSHGRRSSPLPSTVRAFILIARIPQPFLPSSARVELRLPTLSAPNSEFLFIIFHLHTKYVINTVGFELTG